jgi:hypothetical protein
MMGFTLSKEYLEKERRKIKSEVITLENILGSANARDRRRQIVRVFDMIRNLETCKRAFSPTGVYSRSRRQSRYKKVESPDLGPESYKTFLDFGEGIKAQYNFIQGSTRGIDMPPPLCEDLHSILMNIPNGSTPNHEYFLWGQASGFQWVYGIWELDQTVQRWRWVEATKGHVAFLKEYNRVCGRDENCGLSGLTRIIPDPVS